MYENDTKICRGVKATMLAFHFVKLTMEDDILLSKAVDKTL